MPVASGDRRGFIACAVAAGIAALGVPARAPRAQAIVTSGDGLRTAEVRIPTRDGSIPGYMAAPAGRSGLATILVVHEIWGLNASIADVCRRHARAGWLAIAPDLFARQGNPAAFESQAHLMDGLVSRVDDRQVLADLDSTARYANVNGGDIDHLGVTGFGWGGRIAWLYCAHNPILRTGVVWCGDLTGPASPLQPIQPLEVAARLACPVLGLYGADDAGIPVAAVEQMRTRLAGGNASARSSEIVVFPGAPHAFYAPERPSYRKAAAEDGWKRSVNWLRQHVGV